MLVPPPLTPREKQVVTYLVAGATRNEIADALGVSPETIKVYTKTLLQKFGAVNVRDAFKDMDDYCHFYNYEKPLSKLFLLHNEVHLTLDANRQDGISEKTVKVMAMQDGLDELVHTYWSQAKSFKFIVDGQELSGEPDISFQKLLFRQKFGKVLKERDEIELKRTIITEGAFSANYESTAMTIIEPTGTARLRVTFPPCDVPDEVWHKARYGKEPIEPRDTTFTLVDNEAILDIPYTEPGRTYSIQWRWMSEEKLAKAAQ